MGTSTSSKGSPSRVLFDPPWISDIVQKIAPEVAVAEMPVAISPAARFGGARRRLSKYLHSGQQTSLKSSFARYVRQGLCGSARAVSRFRIPIAASVAIWSAFQDILNREEAENGEEDWIAKILASENKLIVLEEILVEHVVPDGGTVDEESCRRSIAFAFSEFERENPDVDILNNNEAAVITIIELFLTHEIFNRYVLDMGQRLERMDISEMPRREKEIMGYIRAALSVKLREGVRNGHRRYTRKEMSAVMINVMRETFEVFEEEEND